MFGDMGLFEIDPDKVEDMPTQNFGQIDPNAHGSDEVLGVAQGSVIGATAGAQPAYAAGVGAGAAPRGVTPQPSTASYFTTAAQTAKTIGAGLQAATQAKMLAQAQALQDLKKRGAISDQMFASEMTRIQQNMQPGLWARYGNTIVLVLLVAAGAGAYWYFKRRR